MYPQYEWLRARKIRRVFIDVWLADGEIEEEDHGGLLNMLGRNQLGCQYPSCACGEMNGFARGEEVARSHRIGRIVRRTSTDIAEIWSRSDMGESSRRRIPIRIASGRYGDIRVK